MRLPTAPVLVCLLIAACGKSNDTGNSTLGPAPSSPEKKVAPATSSKAAASAETKSSEREPPLKLPNQRHKLLEAEWSAYEDVVITNDASMLAEDERQMVSLLIEAAKVVEELYMLQLNPVNLKWRDTLVATGADIEKQLFFRNQMPWCEDNPAPNCRVLDEVPTKKEIGMMHWPEGFREDDVKSLSNEINGRELLSPFTVVRKNPKGGFLAIPFSRHELLGPKMKKLSSLLAKASTLAPHKTLKNFLAGRAEAFMSYDAFPYDKSDLDWISLKGDWEVTVGPYEVYKNPFQTKALFEMYIGREDKLLSAELANLKGRLQDMENALATLVGEDVYKPRKLDTDIAIRAIDVWMASGDARNSRGATVAFHLPNRGEAIEKGLYKKVMLVNHSKAFEAVAKARAELVLEPNQAAMVNFRDNITNTTFHELSHGFGAYHEMVIFDKEGRRTTVKEALRKYDTLLEELKADAIGLWLVKYLNDNKALSIEALHRRYVCNLVHVLGLLQYPLDGTYPQMAAIQLGWFLEHGGVVWHAETGQFQLDPSKMTASLTDLAKTVATIQLTGDFAAADSLYGKYIRKDGDKVMLAPNLTRIRDSVVERFKASGIKSPSLRYEVKGLLR